MAAQPAPSTTMAAVVKETILGGGPEETAHLPALTKAHFLQHAARDAGTGELYMGPAEFLAAIAPAGKDYHKIKREQYGILFTIADQRGNGRLTLADWGAFEHLLSQSDAGYRIAFRLFDVEGAGLVKYDHVRRLYELNKGPDTIPFDWECEWAKLYTGGGGGAKKKRHPMDYGQFSQMLRGLQGERIRQAFQRFDTDGDGFISGEEFGRIILETARHKLSDHVLDNLHTLCSTTAGSRISYANVRAFHHIIKEMDLAELIIRRACAKSGDGRITRADFSTAASSITRFTPFTPLEADILFHFASLDEPSGRLGLGDFAKVLDPSWRNRGGNRYTRGDHDDDGARSGSGRRIMQSVLESVHHFLLGSLAGAFGAFVVYPIDLVKTRMQNQRGARPGERLYKTSIDCFQKVLRNEGFRGLYSGIVPQLVGVAPEKAIKLTVNDLVRGHFTDKQTGHIWWGHEVIAGGTAGGCQVVFTNPLEIVKIRLQIQGEAAKSATEEAAVAAAPKRSAMWIVKNLGLRGLYKGASACLLRDVPFSAIYFPTYSNLKSGLFGESPTKKLNVLQLLTAGAIAGMPAAYLTTPCDVIKTRLQVEARKGESSYTGVRHAAATIMKEEGFRAFFKGGPARIVRSSPQFGFTLAAYELLQGLFPLHDRAAGGHHEDGPVAGAIGSAAHQLGLSAEQSPHIRSRNALKLILDVDESFGKLKMPDQQGWRRLPAIMGGGGAAASVGGK